jgi:hypothetical protein
MNQILASGQHFAIDSIKYYIDNVTSGLYVGLMKNTYVTRDQQLPDDIVEVTSSGYERKLVTGWTKYTNINPYLQGDETSWTDVQSWEDVNGYFVSTTASGEITLWAQAFPYNKRTPQIGTLTIIPQYEQI